MLFYYCNSVVSKSGFRTLQSLTPQSTTRASLDCLSKCRDRMNRSNGICLFRTKAKHIDASHSLLPRRNSRVALFAKGLKLVRIPVLIISVYGLGYNQGIMDYARNPDKKRDSESCWSKL
mmetsp:Transcript_10511/g.19623  ORF Transcript_10511/g.19623 Transcript_10511/m.19623 type:complete len:120 (+) Transcript_10511:47-406(+)